MNPIILLLADGDAFFIGMALVLLGVGARLWVRRKLLLALLRIIGLVGAVLVIASSTPFPVWAYCVWLLLWLAIFVLPVARTKSVVTPAFAAVSILLCFLEFPHHLPVRIPVAQGEHVYVIGDSISAGLDSSERNWPLVLGDISHLNVTNLAEPGATASSALAQVRGIIEPNSLVIIEIGGNDMLGDTDGDEFSKDLDALLSGIPPSSHCAMFELPLLPFRNNYGRAQRTLAARHHVILIPKKCLTSAIGGAGNTIDGLHLSQKGHDALAHSVFRMLEIGDGSSGR